MGDSLPHLWDLGSQDHEDLWTEAAALSEALHAECSLADRIRGLGGHALSVHLPHLTLCGMLLEVFSDAALLAGDDDADWLVRLEAICAIDAAIVPPVGPRGRDRAGGLTVARSWVGQVVELHAMGGWLSTEVLWHVGSDHVTLASGRMVPWAALTSMRLSPRGTTTW